jgi:Ca2+-binding RTX toxin-like protein
MENGEEKNAVNAIIGSVADDTIDTGVEGVFQADTEVDSVNGHSGSDTISTGAGNDLAAGDMVGSEWTFSGGRWVYDPAQIDTASKPVSRDYNDLIQTGSGDDVLLGNGGHDRLEAGAGDDLINAGTGRDNAFGGAGNDTLNLESGNDTAEGGLGADIINAGSGNDLVFGDERAANLLAGGAGDGLNSMSQYGESGHWEYMVENGHECMSRSVATGEGESYTISFELAANLQGGSTSGSVEVLWNGEVVGTFSAASGVFETCEVEVTGAGSAAELTFREVQAGQNSGPEIQTGGPVDYYTKEITVGGETVEVSAFAPGQAKLYQVIDGQLKVFDTAAGDYQDAGDPTGLKINAIGFNVEDDLIYGIAKKAGTDALGNQVEASNLVALDAKGNAYRIGDTPVYDYVGDFDGEGNLWTFQSGLNRVTRIDVDNLDASGDPESVHFDLPDDLFGGRTYDIAFSKEDGAFYAVSPPKSHGGDGQLLRLDISELEDGGAPQITSLPINGTLVDGEMAGGMPKGAYGAVFLDGDGNLYFGLNRGDHDMDSSTAADGGIFKVEADWTSGAAYCELMSDAQATGSNDGAVDPRSADAFMEVDTGTPFLIRNPSVTENSGGNDTLRGGEGDDRMFGGGGDDEMMGGTGNDELQGDAGHDRIHGNSGDDILRGGFGSDKLLGGSGEDTLDGGTGKDYLHGGTGADRLDGGAGADKLVGGTGSDVIAGGAGDDHLWGGQWSADGASDTFVVTGGGGRDLVHDFEVDHDVIDLSAYGLEFSDVKALVKDTGWAAEIDLSGLQGGQPGDRLILKSVDPDDLDESNFIL